MIRVNVVTEGQSEMYFVKRVLNPYYNGKVIFDARSVLTSTKAHYEYRGGLVSYIKAKNDIVRWLKENQDAYVSTMFDFFRLPTDFPDYDRAMQCENHYKSVEILEAAMKADIMKELPQIPPDRFIPYIQLHEFEALLYTDINVLKYDYFEDSDIKSIDCLYEATKDIPPEEINHGADTAPSVRLQNAVSYQKGDISSEWLETISIDSIRARCPHFSNWINTFCDL